MLAHSSLPLNTNLKYPYPSPQLSKCFSSTPHVVFKVLKISRFDNLDKQFLSDNIRPFSNSKFEIDFSSPLPPASGLNYILKIIPKKLWVPYFDNLGSYCGFWSTSLLNLQKIPIASSSKETFGWSEEKLRPAPLHPNKFQSPFPSPTLPEWFNCHSLRIIKKMQFTKKNMFACYWCLSLKTIKNFSFIKLFFCWY